MRKAGIGNVLGRGGRKGLEQVKFCGCWFTLWWCTISRTQPQCTRNRCYRDELSALTGRRDGEETITVEEQGRVEHGSEGIAQGNVIETESATDALLQQRCS